MSGYGMVIASLLAGCEKAPLRVAFGLCSGNRHRKSACRACVAVCPRGLLRVGERGLDEAIDLAGCTRCGLCATVCPNGVFEVREPSDLAILAKIRSVVERKARLTIGCDAGGDHGRKSPGDLTLACLGRLNEGLLVAAAAMGAAEILLRTDACRACEQKAALPVVERSVDTSRELLRAFGTYPKIRFLGTAAAAEAAQDGDGGAIEEPSGRREFLNRLGSRAVAAAATAVESALDGFTEAVSPPTPQAKAVGLEYRVPTKRKVLLHFLRKLGAPALEHLTGAHLPLAQVRIRQNCTLCDRCSQFCPTGALMRITAAGAVGIEFALSRCTGCGVCALACVDGALSLGTAIATAELLSDAGKRLLSHAAYHCAACNHTFGASAPKRYCPYCERKMALRNTPW